MGPDGTLQTDVCRWTCPATPPWKAGGWDPAARDPLAVSCPGEARGSAPWLAQSPAGVSPDGAPVTALRGEGKPWLAYGLSLGGDNMCEGRRMLSCPAGEPE
jgi:hypothetical protein